MKTVLAGLRYIYEKKIVFGSISLDLFAVLLGGRWRCYPSTRGRFCGPDRGDWAFCAARQPSVPREWPS